VVGMPKKEEPKKSKKELAAEAAAAKEAERQRIEVRCWFVCF
jgi:hypothetical protein